MTLGRRHSRTDPHECQRSRPTARGRAELASRAGEESRRDVRLAYDRANTSALGAVESKGGTEMKIEIKRVEAIKATRCHLDPDAGGA